MRFQFAAIIFVIVTFSFLSLSSCKRKVEQPTITQTNEKKVDKKAAEYKFTDGKIEGIKVVYVGDGNNVAHSLMIAGTKLGAHVVVATPEGYEPDARVIKWAEKNAAESGGVFELLHDPIKAVKDADVIYTDVWASMGQEAEAEERRKIFKPFQVNKDLVKHAKPDYIFMHCLPAHRGEEVTDDVVDSPNSVVFDEAENRLHAQKAAMALVMGGIKL